MSLRGGYRIRFEAFWIFVFSFFLLLPLAHVNAQSIARKWNNVLIEAIKNDLARPTVHARNLYHHSVAMYDVWALYDDEARMHFLGTTMDGFQFDFSQDKLSGDQDDIDKAISFASYRLLKHRFKNSPGAETSLNLFDSLFQILGYDHSFQGMDYASKDPAAIGNYIAQRIIEYGLQDGSNEIEDYANRYYEPVNGSFVPRNSGIDSLVDPNRWQPLRFERFIDQSGNEIEGGLPQFLSAEWGWVNPFALEEGDATIFERDGEQYKVYLDPGPPVFIDTAGSREINDFYRWNFELVAKWSSHLDHTQDVLWDISPKSIGNISPEDFPTDSDGYKSFYDFEFGGDIGKGYELNPITEEPYAEQWKKRGDYARVLAEFWADGPDSETPPGHWFTILNYINDHPEIEKRIGGEGELVDDLEWDVKSYFLLGGAMHDAAIAAWSVKGYYDYIRPISAIRYMGEQGQSSDSLLPNFDAAGLTLSDGFVEVIEEGDPLQGFFGEHIGKLKVNAWSGHPNIADPEFDVASVDWILVEDWNPYQRQTFVTPPFAGYVSGHSTFSRAAAEVLTLLTGSPYFPGGLGSFSAFENKFLVFEEGPSEDIILEWATYRDASDQCSLSRIWGGIHPPIDDIPGRKIGLIVGEKAFLKGKSLFTGKRALGFNASNVRQVFPNPASQTVRVRFDNTINDLKVRSIDGKACKVTFTLHNKEAVIKVNRLPPGIYLVTNKFMETRKFVKK